MADYVEPGLFRGFWVMHMLKAILDINGNQSDSPISKMGGPFPEFWYLATFS